MQERERERERGSVYKREIEGVINRGREMGKGRKWVAWLGTWVNWLEKGMRGWRRRYGL